jgi:hypothetical protein
MVLAVDAPRMTTVFRAAQWLPTVIAWVLVLSVVTFFAWTYFSNPQPGPYGMCYSRGHAVGCNSLKHAR